MQTQLQTHFIHTTFHCRIPGSSAKLFKKFFGFINSCHFGCHANLIYDLYISNLQLGYVHNMADESYLSIVIVVEKFGLFQP